MKEYFEKFKALSRTKQIVIVVIILVILGALFGDDKKPSYRSNESSYESNIPDFTCINCGKHSFHYHETLTDLKVCNSCGAGQ
jgi:hypothetical protein